MSNVMPRRPNPDLQSSLQNYLNEEETERKRRDAERRRRDRNKITVSVEEFRMEEKERNLQRRARALRKMANSIEKKKRGSLALWQTTCSKLPMPEDTVYVVPNYGTDPLLLLDDDDVLYHLLTSLHDMSEQTAVKNTPLVVGRTMVLSGDDLDHTEFEMDEGFWTSLSAHKKAIGVCIIGLDVTDIPDGHATMLFVHKHDEEMFGFVIDPNSHEWGGDREKRLRNVLKRELVTDGKLLTLKYLEVPYMNFGVTPEMNRRLDELGFATTNEGGQCLKLSFMYAADCICTNWTSMGQGHFKRFVQRFVREGDKRKDAYQIRMILFCRSLVGAAYTEGEQGARLCAVVDPTDFFIVRLGYWMHQG